MKMVYLDKHRTHYEWTEIDEILAQAIEQKTVGHAGFVRCLWYTHDNETYCLVPGNRKTTIGIDPEPIGGWIYC